MRRSHGVSDCSRSLPLVFFLTLFFRGLSGERGGKVHTILTRLLGMNCEKNAVVCEGYHEKQIWKSGKERAEEGKQR